MTIVKFLPLRARNNANSAQLAPSKESDSSQTHPSTGYTSVRDRLRGSLTRRRIRRRRYCPPASGTIGNVRVIRLCRIAVVPVSRSGLRRCLQRGRRRNWRCPLRHCRCNHDRRLLLNVYRRREGIRIRIYGARIPIVDAAHDPPPAEVAAVITLMPAASAPAHHVVLVECPHIPVPSAPVAFARLGRGAGRQPKQNRACQYRRSDHSPVHRFPLLPRSHNIRNSPGTNAPFLGYRGGGGGRGATRCQPPGHALT